jgi:hypothetical protein
MSIAQTIKTAATTQGAHNPFRVIMSTPSKHTDPSKLVICDDKIQPHKAPAGTKYTALFQKMKLGQAIKCHPGEMGRVSGAMRAYIRRASLNAKVLATKNYGDGMSRVWLMEADTQVNGIDTNGKQS